jgi:hypothetical protein
MLLLLEGQMHKAWESSKKQSDHWTQSTSASLLKGYLESANYVAVLHLILEKYKNMQIPLR